MDWDRDTEGLESKVGNRGSFEAAFINSATVLFDRPSSSGTKPSLCDNRVCVPSSLLVSLAVSIDFQKC